MNSRRFAHGALCALLVGIGHGAASAQTPAAEEAALRQRYDVSHWAAGPLHGGITVARLAIGGLQLRFRTDRPAIDGGMSLSFGTNVTTLRVRIAVASNAVEGRDSLVGFLRAAQADLVPLANAQGADVGLGDTAVGAEAVAALYGNVAISVQRTREAGAETPAAWQILAVLRSVLASVGAPTAPVLTLLATGGHVDLQGSAFEHVEATVRGGHLHGVPSPAGIDIVADRTGPVDVRVVATDALGRTVVSSTTVTP